MSNHGHECLRRRRDAPKTGGGAAVVAAVASLLVLAGWLAPVGTVQAAPTQPSQPKSGPGGSDYTHAGVRVTEGGSGANAFYVFEPTSPQPESAPLAIVMHGYFEFTGYEQLQGLIEHTVRRGNVVIYPRWQTGAADPCPGPFDIEPCIASTVHGIKGGLALLQSDINRVRPQLDKTSYFAHSFGGIITANLTNRYAQLGVPRPRAIFLDDPHDGGYTGTREPALDKNLGGIPASTLVQCHSGAHGIFDDPYTGTGDLSETGQPKRDGSCNALFPRLTSVPAENKDLVLTSEDTHGTPALTSDHGVCTGAADGSPAIDAYDWGFCWKVWDAMRSAAYSGTDCDYALGETPQHRYIGTWSDGVPIVGLKIQDAAPIRAEPVPARQAQPPAPKATRSGRCGDRVPPRLKLRYERRQHLGKLAVSVTADEAGKLGIRASVRTRRPARRTVQFKRSSTKVRPGRAVKLWIRPSRARLRMVKKALNRGHALKVRVLVSGRDEVGNLRRARAVIRLTR